jgi:hypothetical protein
MKLQLATREKLKLRLNISGPSGSGKTMSALRMAKGLLGSWDKIAVIDTENRSASIYSHLGPFSVINLEAPYSPERFIEAIDMCLNAGMECIILDSSSHEWEGAGGAKEINDKIAQLKFKGNTWAAWSETTPRHEKFLQKVLQCPAHIITCTRSKTETVMGDDKKVKKVGMKDIQRDGWEYELTVSLSLDRDTHLAQASKDRMQMPNGKNLFENMDAFIITEETGESIKKWCELGIDLGAQNKGKIQTAEKSLQACTTLTELQQAYMELDKDIKVHVEAIKDAMKLKLAPPLAGVEEPVTDSPLPNDFNHTAL